MFSSRAKGLILKWILSLVCSFAVDSCGLGQGRIVGCCEHGNGRSVLIGRKFLEQLRYSQLIWEEPAPLNTFVVGRVKTSFSELSQALQEGPMKQESDVDRVKVKFTLEQTTKAQRGSKVQLFSFLNLCARWGGCSTPRPGRFTPEKDPVPIVQEGGCAPGPVWTGALNLAPSGFDPRTVLLAASTSNTSQFHKYRV